MENVNLMDAQKGDFPEAKQGKTELKIVDYYTVHIHSENGILSNVYGYVCFQGSSRGCRLADLSMLVCLMADYFRKGDSVEVRFSEDGKEVVEMRKVDSCG